MVDLIVFAFLIARDLPVSSIGQILRDPRHLAATLLLDFMAQVKPVNLHPFVQSPII